MNNWINAPLILEGKGVQLISLQPEHISPLVKLADEKSIWQYYAVDGSNTNSMTTSLQASLTEREQGLQFPFAIYHNEKHMIIGSTRYLDLQPMHRKLEIGWTWLHPLYWGTKVNIECKLLLLTHAFDTLKVVRVQLKTDVLNQRSRKAIEKIGGIFEGIFRSDMIRDNGTLRDSAYYSIIQADWPEVSSHLQQLLLR